MANIQAFHGLRYDLSKVGSLSEVTAPPYDVIGPEDQSALYDSNDYNVVRLILADGRDIEGEVTSQDAAALALKRWRRDRVLVRDPAATIYVCHQTFDTDQGTQTRRGFIARCGIEPFGSGKVFAHEQTHARAREDRLRLMTACQANLSPIFGLYDDPANEAQEILESAIDDRTPLVAIDPTGVKTELWQVTDPAAISAATRILGDKDLFIADGHHRYETSAELQRQMVAAGAANDSHGYTMMMFVSLSDPGLVVLPTHRLFRGVEPIGSKVLADKLSPAFDVSVVTAPSRSAEAVWELMQVDVSQGTLGFYCRQDAKWLLAELTDDGAAIFAELEPDRSDAWRGLGVSILHSLVMNHLLKQPEKTAPKYVHTVAEVLEGIEHGDAAGRDATGQHGSGDPFELACLVHPASTDDVCEIALGGSVMPAKSTYFYPKLLSGLVINALDD